MLHLGLSFGHNSTVALVADGQVVFCQSEERLNRVKNSCGIPRATLERVLQMVGGPDKIASCGLYMGFPWSYMQCLAYDRDPGAFLVLGNPLNPELVESWRRDLEQKVADEVADVAAKVAWAADPTVALAARQHMSQTLALPADKLVAMHHHDCHAYSSLPFLPADIAGPVLILTLDGEGDGSCASVSRWENGRLTHIASTPDLCSLGRIYGLVTNVLGFTFNLHEYKIMGMAPYAKREHCQRVVEKLRALLWVDDHGVWHAGYRSVRELSVALADLCAFERFDNVAGGLQLFTEDLMVRWVAHWVAATGIGTVACSGGVFMNVKANQKLAELPGVTRLIVTPSCGDESCAIGAAVFASLATEPATPIGRLDNLYLGSVFPDDAVARYIQEARIAERFVVTEPRDIARAVAELLARNEVVGRCSGRMEFGARALGNRSILANPSEPATVEFINRAIKSRDFWMPFAPSILAENLAEFVDDPKGSVSPFMMVSANATPRGRRALAAAIHRADGTARPQRVERAANPDYHALISRFRDLTGIGAVLNTSFNLHGDPIVCSPHDAVDTVLKSDLRWLAMGRFLLEKRAAA